MKEHPVRDFGLAISQLTILPVRTAWPSDTKPDVASHYVWAGFIIGFTGYAPLKVLEIAGVDWHRASILVAGLVLAWWAVFTRFLHLDGLIDVGDGWFGSSPERRREMASDTHIGSFGAAFALMWSLMEFGALAHLLAVHEMQVMIAPVFARCAATFAAWFGQPAKADGLGAAVVRKPGIPGAISGILGMALAVALMAGAHHLHGFVSALVALVIASLVPYVVAKRFGGVTGDVMGASILIVEALVFVLFAVVG